MSIAQLKQRLKAFSSPKDAAILRRFFKTGKGEYGEGDVFIGVRVPHIRRVAKEFHTTPIADLQKLLRSKIHEERLLSLIILVNRFKKANKQTQKKIYDLYLKHTKFINNWDLVDLTAHHIVGEFLYERDRKPLYRLVKSKLLWDRRISILTTFYFIRKNKFDDTLKLAKLLLKDQHDLMHKAVGWMLREVGKRDQKVLKKFLKLHYKQMPRTMLRYAIEHFPEKKRKRYLLGKI